MTKTLIRSHRDLLVWQRAMELVVSVYRLTKKLPRDEVYGLVGQMRRAAASVPSNIAEGQGRRLDGEFLQFLGHARGSLLELDTQIEVAFRVQYITIDDQRRINIELQEVGRLLNGLMRAIQRTQYGR